MRGVAHWLVDWLLAIVLPLPLRLLRRIRFNLNSYPHTRAAIRHAGVFPVIDHYYEPLVDTRGLTDLCAPRHLPGIDFNRVGQVDILQSFATQPKPVLLARPVDNRLAFDIRNAMYGAADAELWFHMIRHCRPKRIIEIGAGHSTKVAALALDSLRADDPAYAPSHLCIDPFPPEWLGELGVEVQVQRLEEVAREVFATSFSSTART
jgi:hypothetical protein